MARIGTHGQSYVLVRDTIETFYVRPKMVFDITRTLLKNFLNLKFNRLPYTFNDRTHTWYLRHRLLPKRQTVWKFVPTVFCKRLQERSIVLCVASLTEKKMEKKIISVRISTFAKKTFNYFLWNFTHDNGFHSQFRWLINDLFHGGNQYFASFQTESFFARPFSREKSFESKMRKIINVRWPDAGGGRPDSRTANIVKKNSHPCALVSRANINFFWSLSISMTPGTSNRCLIQLHCSNELINMNSQPMCLKQRGGKKLHKFKISQLIKTIAMMMMIIITVSKPAISVFQSFQYFSKAQWFFFSSSNECRRW